jgi:hypothetical protein
MARPTPTRHISLHPLNAEYLTIKHPMFKGGEEKKHSPASIILSIML